MNHKFEIHQILYNWVSTLPIDDLSGESIVTAEDLDRLGAELSETFSALNYHGRIKNWCTNFIGNRIGNLLHKFNKRKVSPNLLNRL